MDECEVSLCYAKPDKVWQCVMTVAQGCTVGAAIAQSRLLADCPDLDLATQRVGIYGKLVGMGTVLRAGDRIEVYRPLFADPMVLRRARIKVTNR